MNKKSLFYYSLQKYISKDSFDKNFFENLLKKDSSSDYRFLIFNSFAKGNLEAFKFFISHIEWISISDKLFKYILKNKSNVRNYIDVLFDNNINNLISPEFNKSCAYMALRASYISNEDSWYIFNKLMGAGQRMDNYPTMLDDIFSINNKRFKDLGLDLLKKGIPAFSIENCFVDFCRIGQPHEVKYFETLGCDLHYHQDLALRVAAQAQNFEMVEFLIEEKKFNPDLANYFVYCTILEEEASENYAYDYKQNYSNYPQNELVINNDLVSFLAKTALTNNPQKYNFYMEKFKYSKRFCSALSYFYSMNNMGKKVVKSSQKNKI